MKVKELKQRLDRMSDGIEIVIFRKGLKETFHPIDDIEVFDLIDDYNEIKTCMVLYPKHKDYKEY